MAGTVYVLGRATTQAVPELRRFLALNASRTRGWTSTTTR